VIAGDRACVSVEHIATLVGRLPLRLAATVLHTAVLQTADDRLTVDRRADVGHRRRRLDDRRDGGAVGRAASSPIAAVDTDGRAGDHTEQAESSDGAQHVPLN